MWKQKKKRNTLIGLMLLVAAFFGVGSLFEPYATAADTDFSDNIITVDSTGDGADANIGDSICDDGSGNCTLRAAIEEANDTAGTQTIEFNISGAADFTSGGQNGYTIQPGSALPVITSTMTIDGYSQPGSQANTAVSPAPLNGTLLIELDGSNAGNADGINFGADGIIVKGLVINNFNASTKDGISVSGNNNSIQGNYIGTEPDGLTAAPNELGISNGAGTSNNLMVGGLNPEDRNLLSGNTEGGSSPNTGHTNWTYYGNYIGVDKTGMAALPNAQPGGSGALSIDNDDGHRVGGPQVGARNVISGNRSMGIAPHNTDDLVVQGNYFGVGADGTTAIPNGSAGINLSDCDNALIGGTADGEENIIHHNVGNGVAMTGSTSNVTIVGNSILHNDDSGVFVLNATNITIGGPSVAERNHIADNTVNVAVTGFGTTVSDVKIQGNYIGTDVNGNIDSSFTANYGGVHVIGQADGVLIGGTAAGESNIIAGHQDFGMAMDSRTLPAFSTTIAPQNISVIGNRIFGNEENNTQLLSSGLGIDHVQTVDNEPDGAVDSSSNVGVTANDATDADTGPNGFINFPVLTDVTQDGTELKIKLDLDATDSTLNDQYRVEFFANDTADPSGHGEGQAFLGYATIESGDAQEATLTLPSGTDLTGKVLAATTTALSNATTSGFGSTSEFSQAADIEVLSAQAGGSGEDSKNDDMLASTGSGITRNTIIGVGIISAALLTMYRRRIIYRLSR